VNVRKSHGKSVVNAELEKHTVGSEWDPQSTEAIALQLLNPIVSEEEEAEYQGFVHVI
jgi:phosphatidylinositol 3,5-bisphosphate 5-phosphatase